MKKFIILFLSTFIYCNLYAQEKPKYDKALADSLQADERGMKMYFLVILKSGPVKIEDKILRDSLFSGHMANIKRLADLGKLSVAGPLEKNDKNYRGIFIMNVKTMEEAKSLLETDPTIQAKVFDTEIYEWYGSAAIQLVSGLHDKISKK